MTETRILLADLVSIVLFAAASWLTRAPTKRAGAALLGGVVAALLNVAWDFAGYSCGWWHYTFVSGPTAPPLTYVPVVFVYGAAMGLIGWRLIRHYHMVGCLAFFAGYVLWGVTRDHLIAARGTVFAFGPGLAPWIADAAGYISLALAVQLSMKLIAGSPMSDALEEANKPGSVGREAK